ncbi:MAG: response regulator [Planctomycetaceae bacterium]
MAGEKILLIEDDRDISASLSGLLQGAGYDVITAPNGIEGQKLILSDGPELVITDMMMPRMGGFPILDFINTLDVKPPVIMMTANEGGRHKAYAEMLGVVDYHRKPFPPEVLLESVRRALDGRTTTSAKPAPSASKQVDDAEDQPTTANEAPATDDVDDGSSALGPLRRSRKKKT